MVPVFGTSGKAGSSRRIMHVSLEAIVFDERMQWYGSRRGVPRRQAAVPLLPVRSQWGRGAHRDPLHRPEVFRILKRELSIRFRDCDDRRECNHIGCGPRVTLALLLEENAFGWLPPAHVNEGSTQGSLRAAPRGFPCPLLQAFLLACSLSAAVTTTAEAQGRNFVTKRRLAGSSPSRPLRS